MGATKKPTSRSEKDKTRLTKPTKVTKSTANTSVAKKSADLKNKLLPAAKKIVGESSTKKIVPKATAKTAKAPKRKKVDTSSSGSKPESSVSVQEASTSKSSHKLQETVVDDDEDKNKFKDDKNGSGDKTKTISKNLSKMLKSLDIQISGFDSIIIPTEEIIVVGSKSSISENVKTKSRAASKVNVIPNLALKPAKKETGEKELKKEKKSEIEKSDKDKDKKSNIELGKDWKELKMENEQKEKPKVSKTKAKASGNANLSACGSGAIIDQETNNVNQISNDTKEPKSTKNPEKTEIKKKKITTKKVAKTGNTETPPTSGSKAKKVQTAKVATLKNPTGATGNIKPSKPKPAKPKVKKVTEESVAGQLKISDESGGKQTEDAISTSKPAKPKTGPKKDVKSTKDAITNKKPTTIDKKTTAKKKDTNNVKSGQTKKPVAKKDNKKSQGAKIQTEQVTIDNKNNQEILDQNKSEESKLTKTYNLTPDGTRQQVPNEIAEITTSNHKGIHLKTEDENSKKKVIQEEKINKPTTSIGNLASKKEITEIAIANLSSSDVLTFQKRQKKCSMALDKYVTVEKDVKNLSSTSSKVSKAPPVKTSIPTKKAKKENSLLSEKRDVYDFNSGSDNDDNIKMELPTLKKLREFSDDDDKPLELTKQKLIKQIQVAHKDGKAAIQNKSVGDKKHISIFKVDKKPVIPIKKHVEVIAKKSGKIKAEKKPVVNKVPRKGGKVQTDSTDGSNSLSSESEDEKLIIEPKCHRMASLNALAKVQCLYENEARTAHELGLSKTIQMPKIRTLNSSCESEDDKDLSEARLKSIKKEPITIKTEIKKEIDIDKENEKDSNEESTKDDSEVEIEEIENTRELRNAPGMRGVGKHWEYNEGSSFESAVDSEIEERRKVKKRKLQKLKSLHKKEKEKASGSHQTKKVEKGEKSVKKKKAKLQVSSDYDSESSDSSVATKKIASNKNEVKRKSEPKKRKKPQDDIPSVSKGKRIASLNASALVAATYEVERHLDRNFSSDFSYDSFGEDSMQAGGKKAKFKFADKSKEKLSEKDKAKLKNKEKCKTNVDKNIIKNIKKDPGDDAGKDTKDVKDGSSRPTSSSVVIVQDTDVTITGVYVNASTGSSQEAYCKMQYRVQSSVMEERVIGSSPIIDPPKSYTPLNALSSMRPPGAAGNPSGIIDGQTMHDQPPSSMHMYSSGGLNSEQNATPYHYSSHHNSTAGPQMTLIPLHQTYPQDMHHYNTHQQSSHHYHQQQPTPIHPTPMQQSRCESPMHYQSGGYQSIPQQSGIQLSAGGGSSAFCAPNMQQQQQHHHDLTGYYQPAGPLISPHALPPVSAQSANATLIPQTVTGSKNKLSNSLNGDSEQLQQPPQSTSTADSTDSDVLITGGDLSTFHYPSLSQQTSQSQASAAAHQQQSQQQHLHHQQAAAAQAAAAQAAAAQAAAAAAAAAQNSSYARSMHQMHYAPYPSNYYSPYPGEAMCYSPPYQSYFPTKVYQSAPTYRRYPPSYYPGPPQPSDLYETSPPSSSQPPPPPPSGTQLVPAGPTGHSQHIEHYPPGYYSNYSPAGGQCYSRPPYMDYPPPCPCPMQQSCPKNALTGPHIGSNSSNCSSGNTTSSSSNSKNNNNNNNTLTSLNSTNKTTTQHMMNSNDNINNKIKSSSTMNTNISNSSSHLSTNSGLNSNNNNKNQQLNSGRGPVKNLRNNNPHSLIVGQIGVADSNSIPLTELNSIPLSHIGHTCKLEHDEPFKSILKLENDNDMKTSQYEEDVISPPPTLPINYSVSNKLHEPKRIVNGPPMIGSLIVPPVLEQSVLQSGGGDQISQQVQSQKAQTIPENCEQILIQNVPVIGRKARLGKTMAREMMYGIATMHHPPVHVQLPTQISKQSTTTPLTSSSQQQTHIFSGNINANGTLIHPSHNNHSTNSVVNENKDVNSHSESPLRLLKAEIKKEDIKTEVEEVVVILDDEKQDIKNIKTEPEIVEVLDDLFRKAKEIEENSTINISSEIDDDVEITSPSLLPSKRIKILEFNKSQCKKSPTNGYKSLIKQAEPKSYLCLSRKFDKKDRFGKLSKTQNVRKRKFVLTEQQKKRLKLRKKKLIEMELIQQQEEKLAKEAKEKELTEKRKQAELKEREDTKLKLQNDSASLLDKTIDLVARGYFSEPEFRTSISTLSLSAPTAGRKLKKTKAGEVRSKSESKKSTMKTSAKNSTSTAVPDSSLKERKGDNAKTPIGKSGKSKHSNSKEIHDKTNDKNIDSILTNVSIKSKTKSAKGKKKYKDTEKSMERSSVREDCEEGKIITTTTDKVALPSTAVEKAAVNGEMRIESLIDSTTEEVLDTAGCTANSSCAQLLDNTSIPDKDEADTPTISNNNSLFEANKNQLVLEADEVDIENEKGEQTATTEESVFRLPEIPAWSRPHHGPTKRGRSRCKFGSRKRTKRRHTEIDETIIIPSRNAIPKWNNGWSWEGEPFQGTVFLNSDDPLVIRTCYPAMRHSEGDIIRPRDCVLLRAGSTKKNELPYVAKVAYLWENPEDGEMMMSLLWYYRPEHTEQGRQPGDCDDEVFASKHRDHNSVACIEDKCYVLTFNEYCRYRRRVRAMEENVIEALSIVPKLPVENARQVPPNTNSELVMFCQRVYEFRSKRLMKLPNT